MESVLRPLTPADYTFLAGLIDSNVNLTDDATLHRLVDDYAALGTPEAKAALDARFEHELRYLGSADIAYLVRYLSGQRPGVSFEEIVRDVARALKVTSPAMGTAREQAEALVEAYVTRQFTRMTPEEQQAMLVDLGVAQDKAAAFIKHSAGRFAVPMLIQAFGTLVVDGLIKTVIFGTIARIVGRQLAGRLFQLVAGRFPWWLRWVGPAAWSLSIGWTVIDLQGPALRKTIPVTLYLGLCALRERHAEGTDA